MLPNPESGENRPLIFLSQIARVATEISCEACCVQIHEINSKRRQRAHVAMARQIATYLSHVVGQLSMPEVAVAFERDRTTIAHACHIIEDRSDSRIFDAQIEILEREMRRRLDSLYARISLCGAPTALDVKIARMHLARARAS